MLCSYIIKLRIKTQLIKDTRSIRINSNCCAEKRCDFSVFFQEQIVNPISLQDDGQCQTRYRPARDKYFEARVLSLRTKRRDVVRIKSIQRIDVRLRLNDIAEPPLLAPHWRIIVRILRTSSVETLLFRGSLGYFSLMRIPCVKSGRRFRALQIKMAF